MLTPQRIIHLFLFVSIVLTLGTLWWRTRASPQKRTDEPFDGEIDDLQGNKILGIRIKGTRVLQIGDSGIRFTPQGSSTNQSALQFYYQDDIDLGSWRLGTASGPTAAVLAPSIRVQRIGNLVTLQFRSLGLVTFGSVPAKGVNMILSEKALPDFLKPTIVQPTVFVSDLTKSNNPTTGLCTATVDAEGRIQIQRFTRAASLAGNKATLNLTSFVLQYLV
jgi:hypothetical protein